jgi:hypothetical protein
MAAFTCEYSVPASFRDLYDLNDELSLEAFHGWLGKRISNLLSEKYGLLALDLIPQHEIWRDDLGLISDCDFEDLDDGALLITFSREPCSKWGILHDEDLTRHADGTLEVNFEQARTRAAQNIQV